MLKEVRNDMAKDHYTCFGHYINSLKEVISKIPSKRRSNRNITLRVDQDNDWRSLKKHRGCMKTKKILFHDDDEDNKSVEK